MRGFAAVVEAALSGSVSEYPPVSASMLPAYARPSEMSTNIRALHASASHPSAPSVSHGFVPSVHRPASQRSRPLQNKPSEQSECRRHETGMPPPPSPALAPSSFEPAPPAPESAGPSPACAPSPEPALPPAVEPPCPIDDAPLPAAPAVIPAPASPPMPPAAPSTRQVRRVTQSSAVEQP